MTAHVRPVTVSEVFDAPVFAALCEQYRAECTRNPDLLGTPPDRTGYQNLFDLGALHPLGVFVGEEMVGICALLLTPVLHCAGKLIASTETLFVAPDHRAGGAGRLLLRAAQARAVALGASGLYVTAPVGGRLARLLPRQGYHATNQVFYRRLA